MHARNRELRKVREELPFSYHLILNLPRVFISFRCIAALLMELYIYGPAFGLPSADPECIAAAALLSRTVPAEVLTLVVAYASPTTTTGKHC